MFCGEYLESGTLWEGRYKSSPINKDEYLLACCRYVELNPVRAAMVDEPEEYRWSSYRYKGARGSNPILFGTEFDRVAQGMKMGICQT